MIRAPLSPLRQQFLSIQDVSLRVLKGHFGAYHCIEAPSPYCTGQSRRSGSGISDVGPGNKFRSARGYARSGIAPTPKRLPNASTFGWLIVRKLDSVFTPDSVDPDVIYGV